MKIRIAAITDAGKERDSNEDSIIFCPDLSQQDWTQSSMPGYVPLSENGAVLVVADGMGGANAGEVASAIATETVRKKLTKENIEHAVAGGEIKALLVSCVKDADEAIFQAACQHAEAIGMGTTIVVCWVIGEMAHVVWCGDSRCYVYNPFRGLRQLTKDHTLVQELVDKGEITEEKAFTHPDNSVLSRALGDVDSEATPDTASFAVGVNDMLILCSDGLSGYRTNKQIELVVRASHFDVASCCDQLLKCSLEAGGADNISIVVASLIGDSQSAPARPSPVCRLLNRIARSLHLLR